MRHLFFGLAAVLLVSGCADSKWSPLRHSQDNVRLPADKLPTSAQLVSMLNSNAAKIQSLQCTNLELDVKQGSLQDWHIDGKLVCQKPRHFRMQALALGHTEADIGSNDQEFWYWIKHGDPYLIHCSYQDLANGGVRIPFPFQPDWVMEALGMSEYEIEPVPAYSVQPNGRTIQLVQLTRNSQGKRVRKVTEFNPSRWYVSAHVLQDEAGKEICRAQIIESQQTAEGAVLPRKVTFSYPAEGFQMRMTLGRRANDLILNQRFDAQRANELFSRPALSGVPSYDLARGRDGANSISPAGGVLQR